MIVAYHDGGQAETLNFDSVDDFKSSTSIDTFASQLIVEGGSEDELIAVAEWAASIIENTVLVLSDSQCANPYAKEPISFLRQIREDWDLVDMSGASYNVQSIRDIVNLSSAASSS